MSGQQASSQGPQLSGDALPEEPSEDRPMLIWTAPGEGPGIPQETPLRGRGLCLHFQDLLSYESLHGAFQKTCESGRARRRRS